MAKFVGHVNRTFSHREVNKETRSEVLTCPYDYSHQVPFDGFARHLEVCPKAASKRDSMETCDFNPVHFYPSRDEEREDHLTVCPNRHQAPVKERSAKKVVYKICLPLPPLRERAGIENPRIAPVPMPSVQHIIGPDVQFVDLEKYAEERMERARRASSTVLQDAMDLVVREGPRPYGEYKELTSLMSQREKTTFSIYLEEKTREAEAVAHYYNVVKKRLDRSQ